MNRSWSIAANRIFGVQMIRVVYLGPNLSAGKEDDTGPTNAKLVHNKKERAQTIHEHSTEIVGGAGRGLHTFINRMFFLKLLTLCIQIFNKISSWTASGIIPKLWV